MTGRLLPAPAAGAILMAAQLLSACGFQATGQPWDRPADGATSATEWVVESAVGADDEVFDSPDAILELVREVEMGTWSARADDVAVGTVEDDGDDTLIGYVRTTFPERSHPMRAVDLRLQLRQVTGGWVIDRAERRYQCAAEMATEFCQ